MLPRVHVLLVLGRSPKEDVALIGQCGVLMIARNNLGDEWRRCKMEELDVPGNGVMRECDFVILV